MAYVQHHGFTSTTLNNGRQTNKQEVEWQSDYDGSYATLDVNVNNNGQHQYWSATLDNHDLQRMLSVPSHSTPLLQRLVQDFPLAKKRQTTRRHRSHRRLTKARKSSRS